MADSDSGTDLPGGNPVEDVPQVGDSRGQTLREAGYTTVQELRRADVSDLAGLFNDSVARTIKENAGDLPKNPPDISEAKSRAQEIPGAMAKTVKIDGRQQAKVLRKVEESNIGGATLTVHKG